MKNLAIFHPAEGLHHTISYTTPMNDGHFHNSNELFFLMEGTMTACCNTETVEVNGPAVVIFSSYSIHSGGSMDDKIYDRYILFFKDPEQGVTPFSQAMTFFKQDHLTVIPLDDFQKSVLLSYFQRLHYHTESEAREHLIQWILYELSCWYEPSQCSPSRNTHYIHKVMQQLSQQFHCHISLEELANQHFISRAKLVADFKRYTGMTVGEYRSVIRIHNAKAMLEQGYSVGKTAHACGYGDESYFIEKFTRFFGVTPKAYAKGIKG